MKVKQIASILTSIYNEITGESGVIAEDLSGIVDTGKTLSEIGDDILSNGVDNYVKSLVNKIGKVVFVDRVYKSAAPNILKDSWEYGAILEKVRCEVDDYKNNDTWSLEKGRSYDPFVFNPPTVTSKFFNSKTAFELSMSFTEHQVKESFRNASEMNKFFAMIENRQQMKKTLATDSMIQRTLNNLIGEKINSNNNVINLLALYKNENPNATELTVKESLSNKDFLKFCSMQIGLYSDNIARASQLYNNDGYVTFTPIENQRLVVLSRFAEACKYYMESETYHKELVALKGYSTVPYWQGSGNSATIDFDEISKINLKTFEGEEVVKSGIVATLFDNNAAAVCNENYRVTTAYNAKGEFTNYFYKYDCSYMNDLAENCIVFIIE